MNTQEFLHELERSLRGKVDDRELKKQSEYYSSYIKNEINAGHTEEEVLMKLGDPRLIARTIVQAYNMKYNMKDDASEDRSRKNSADTNEGGADGRGGSLRSKIQKYLIIAADIIIIFSVMSLVFPIIRIFLPIIFMIIIIMLIIRMKR